MASLVCLPSFPGRSPHSVLLQSRTLCRSSDPAKCRDPTHPFTASFTQPCQALHRIWNKKRHHTAPPLPSTGSTSRVRLASVGISGIVTWQVETRHLTPAVPGLRIPASGPRMLPSWRLLELDDHAKARRELCQERRVVQAPTTPESLGPGLRSGMPRSKGTHLATAKAVPQRQSADRGAETFGCMILIGSTIPSASA